jgi:hypothetical protein
VVLPLVKLLLVVSRRGRVRGGEILGKSPSASSDFQLGESSCLLLRHTLGPGILLPIFYRFSCFPVQSDFCILFVLRRFPEPVACPAGLRPRLCRGWDRCLSRAGVCGRQLFVDFVEVIFVYLACPAGRGRRAGRRLSPLSGALQCGPVVLPRPVLDCAPGPPGVSSLGAGTPGLTPRRLAAGAVHAPIFSWWAHR